VEPDISELSYAFALTSELIARHGLKRAGAPEFATQLAESKPGGGWDAKLPRLPIYLQFKRPDRMVRRTASHADLFLELPFFRMHLRKKNKSRQHQLLLDLEENGNEVFYCAPAFSTMEELNDAYTQNLITERSLFLRPSAIGSIRDDTGHHVVFQTPARAFFCSEPRHVEWVDLDNLISQSLRPKVTAQAEESANQFYTRLAQELLETYENREYVSTSHKEQLGLLRQQRAPAEFANLVAHILFDVDILVASPGDV